MRTPLVLLASLSIVAAAAPAAQAAHIGPCWHEYVEIALYGAVNIKNGGAKYILQGYSNCVKGTVYWVCNNPTFTCELS